MIDILMIFIEVSVSWLQDTQASKAHGFNLASRTWSRSGWCRSRPLFRERQLRVVWHWKQDKGRHPCDIRDGEKMKEIFAEYQPEIVFHLAAQPLVRLSYDIPVETYQTNVMGTIHILEAIRFTDSVSGRDDNHR